MPDPAERLRALHHGPPILVLPNAWDAASARLFEAEGFPAVATTSAGVAAALGYPDGGEAFGLEQPGAGGVPGVWQDQNRRPVVERAEPFGGIRHAASIEHKK